MNCKNQRIHFESKCVLFILLIIMWIVYLTIFAKLLISFEIIIMRNQFFYIFNIVRNKLNNFYGL